MSAYGSLAASYDRLTSDVPYAEILAFVQTLLTERGSKLQTLGVVVMQCVVAWLAAGIFYQLGRLL